MVLFFNDCLKFILNSLYSSQLIAQSAACGEMGGDVPVICVYVPVFVCGVLNTETLSSREGESDSCLTASLVSEFPTQKGKQIWWDARNQMTAFVQFPLRLVFVSQQSWHPSVFVCPWSYFPSLCHGYDIYTHCVYIGRYISSYIYTMCWTYWWVIYKAANGHMARGVVLVETCDMTLSSVSSGWMKMDVCAGCASPGVLMVCAAVDSSGWKVKSAITSTALTFSVVEVEDKRGETESKERQNKSKTKQSKRSCSKMRIMGCHLT